ncbi:ABC transporter substrate-binding protein [Budviciaceae bacterium CWB-B4]|uniref:ABC transporter substrate-binding protein n=1 Tax=Limnobaculum xujianqingii TaxID=2738837 RepID=A0A9D7AM36_9GAMM|nr:ABC transporter substrate-binding protein [Limnobaculum xujianqingii]MBK5075025.1 ABC transporter substrate-binding protein [Limnobaculum xujianqingii]MBK5178332.1 ABC transporter substrate-binding protein [Limnobaculum xujianqingii]
MKSRLSLFALCLLTAAASTSVIAQNHTLKLAIGAEPSEGFDPLLGWSHGSYVLLHSPLLRQNADLSWQPVLVNSYKLSDDGLTWTVHLKPDLKFSDGSPLTADDVVFSYNQAAISGGKADMGSFQQAKAVDKQTLTIQLKHPESTFINVLGALGIVPQAKYGKDFARQPIGAGPYKLTSLQPGQQLIVEANPYYVGKKNDFNKLVFVFLDQDSAYAAASSGKLDLVRVPQTLANQPVNNMKLLVQPSVENRGIMFPMIPAGKKDAQGNDIGNNITADIAIRQAINYAVDRQLLANQLFDGHATPAYTAVKGLPWDNPEAQFKDGDVEKARQILQQAGWVNKTPDGIREKNGTAAKLTLWYASGDSTRRDLAQAFSSMLKPIGIEVTLKSGSWETVERYMHANPTLFGWGSLDPMELYHHYSSKLQGEGYFNPGYYTNAKVDKHLQQAIETPNWQAATPIWQKVDWDGATGVGIKGDAAWAWLINLNHTYLVNPCVSLGQGAPEAHGDWTVLNNLENWSWTCK